MSNTPRGATKLLDCPSRVGQLRDAADHLEALVRRASPRGVTDWRVSPDDPLTLVQAAGSPRALVTAATPGMAAYLQWCSPLSSLTICHLMRTTAHEVETHAMWAQLPPDLARFVQKRAAGAGELAQRILGVTS